MPTRRRVLAWMAVAVVGLGALAGWTRRRALRDWLLDPPLGDAPPGPLDPATLDVLAATVTGLLDEQVTPAHYLDVFRWRAEHVPGARALYRRHARRMERAARRAGHAGFIEAPAAARRALLAPLRPEHGRGRLGRLLFARDDDRISRHVVREVIRHFARTDAWLRSGYDSWPGMPRGIARLPRQRAGA